MVHWGQPTTPAMARQHTLQLPLLLEMAKKEGMSRLGCCCTLVPRAAQVYWLAKCHTALASAIWPKSPSSQALTTATRKTPHAQPNIQPHCHRTPPISPHPQ